MTGLSRLTPGLIGTSSLTVTAAHTAAEIGSGTIAVFATPAMIALMEAAAIDCIERLLPEGHASLGTHVDVAHVAPTPVGARVTATAELLTVDGRSVTFRVEARDEHETIGQGTHTRVIVATQRFLAKAARKSAGPRGSSPL
jgi:predicted thioesterase